MSKDGYITLSGGIPSGDQCFYCNHLAVGIMYRRVICYNPECKKIAKKNYEDCL